jgi:DNA primase
MDVIQAHQGGFDYTIASLGTALTNEQAKIIKRYTTEVILAYDADTAGQNATLKGVEILRENGINVKVLTLPEGHDPESFIQTNGPDAFAKQLEKVEDFVSFKIRNTINRMDLHTPTGKAEAVQEILPHLASVNSHIAREEYIRMISRQIGISETSILEELRNWAFRQRKKSQLLDRNYDNSYTKETGDTGQNTSQHIGLTKPENLSPLKKAIFEVEKELLQSALQEYDKFERIKEKLNRDQLSFEVWREFWNDLIHQNPTAENFKAILEEIQDSMRETAVTLLAEAEVKNAGALDPEGMLNRLEMLRLQEKVQDLTIQISNGCDENGNILTEADLKRRIIEFTELKKRLQKDFPNFGAEI